MDYKFIILAIVGIIIAYLIYSYAFSLPGKKLKDNTVYLGKTDTSASSITFNTLGSSVYKSNNLTYYAWVYVNSKSKGFTDNPTNSNIPVIGNIVFGMNNITGTKTQPTPDTTNIYNGWAFGNNMQDLYFLYKTTNTTKCIPTVTNIPIQKWSFIATVLDNTTVTKPIMDVYYNGKLLNSIVLDSTTGNIYTPPTPPIGLNSESVVSSISLTVIPPSTTVNAITFGNSQDVYVSNLSVSKDPLQPNDIQNAYLSFAGSENSAVNGSMHYGISLVQGSGHNMSSSDFKFW